MKRRRFFQSLVKAAGIIALAPQLAFRVTPLRIQPVFWSQTKCAVRVYDDEYLQALHRLEMRGDTLTRLGPVKHLTAAELLPLFDAGGLFTATTA